MLQYLGMSHHYRLTGSAVGKAIQADDARTALAKIDNVEMRLWCGDHFGWYRRQDFDRRRGPSHHLARRSHDCRGCYPVIRACEERPRHARVVILAIVHRVIRTRPLRAHPFAITRVAHHAARAVRVRRLYKRTKHARKGANLALVSRVAHRKDRIAPAIPKGDDDFVARRLRHAANIVRRIADNVRIVRPRRRCESVERFAIDRHDADPEAGDVESHRCRRIVNVEGCAIHIQLGVAQPRDVAPRIGRWGNVEGCGSKR